MEKQNPATGEWACPKCGRKYAVPPKWCPCEPYPMDKPHLFYFLVALDLGKEFRFDGDLPAMSMLGLLQDSDQNPFKEATLVVEREGWGAFNHLPLEGDDSREIKPPGPDVASQIDFLVQKRVGDFRNTPASATTGFMLLEEFFEPHVESLDETRWRVLDITSQEYYHLLSLYAEERKVN